jgi:hypothetical protein
MIILYVSVVKFTGINPTAFAVTASLLLKEVATIFHKGIIQIKPKEITMV